MTRSRKDQLTQALGASLRELVPYLDDCIRSQERVIEQATNEIWKNQLDGGKDAVSERAMALSRAIGVRSDMAFHKVRAEALIDELNKTPLNIADVYVEDFDHTFEIDFLGRFEKLPYPLE